MPAELHDLQAVQGDVPDDLSRLPSLEEERVRNALQKRFERNQIYTHINSLLGARRLRASACTVEKGRMKEE